MKAWSGILAVVFAIASIVVFSNFNCGKHHVRSDAHQAIISGFDPRACSCCGGLVINFDGDSIMFRGQWYLVKNDAATLGITASSPFPLHATVTYDVDPAPPCNGDGAGFVLIKSIQIR